MLLLKAVSEGKQQSSLFPQTHILPTALQDEVAESKQQIFLQPSRVCSPFLPGSQTIAIVGGFNPVEKEYEKNMGHLPQIGDDHTKICIYIDIQTY